MNNNCSENDICPFAIVRKNFVLMKASNGANASSVLFSMAEASKGNEINSTEYFELILTEIPKHMEYINIYFLDNLLLCKKHLVKMSRQNQKIFNSLIKVQIYKIAVHRRLLIYRTHVRELTKTSL